MLEIILVLVVVVINNNSCSSTMIYKARSDLACHYIVVLRGCVLFAVVSHECNAKHTTQGMTVHPMECQHSAVPMAVDKWQSLIFSVARNRPSGNFS